MSHNTRAAQSRAASAGVGVKQTFAAHKEKMRRQLDEAAQYKIIVAYRDESETEPQWIAFTGTDKEEVRGQFEEFALLNYVYSVSEVGA